MAGTLQIGGLTLRNRVISAPMAGVSDIAFRYMAWRMGAGLTCTEMASAKGLVQGDRKTMTIVKTHGAAKPYSVQIFGHNESDLGVAARIVEDMGADVVDLNLGCPVRKIVRSGCGGALLKNLPLVGKMISRMRRSASIPLTVKFRAGWDERSNIAVQLARIAEQEGADALTVHPRFVQEGFTGTARWEIIRQVKEAVKIPVIGNGDIKSAYDALTMMTITGCDGVMLGRAGMGNPFIFRETVSLLEDKREAEKPSLDERLSVALAQLDIMLEYLPEKVAMVLWRKHLCWYAKGLPFAGELRSRIFQMEDVGQLKSLAVDFFSEQISEVAGETVF